ncbi:MAG: hypothetical protein E2591_26610 [Achromobacter sp.]|nr:hypothetical protein [Achromobacter sp.]
MKRKPPPIQARNTILARDIADKLAAHGSGDVPVFTCLELVAAARGFASYAAYTQAIKDGTEPADFKMAQFWFVDPYVVAPRIATLGLADLFDTVTLVYALTDVVDELIANYPGRLMVIARSPQAFFEHSLATIVSDSINDVLNRTPKAREDLANRSLDQTVTLGTLSVDKVGPLPDKVGGWLRASVHGSAGHYTTHGSHADREGEDAVEFTARIRLRRTGKQLYAGCQAEMLVINDLISDGVKPDPWSDPVALTALIGTGAPDPADQQTGLMLLRILEQSGRVPTLSEIDRIIDSFGRYSRQQLELVETYAAPLAVRLINLKKALMPPQGVRILEALVAAGCQFSKLSLAHALHNGWGCKEDSVRARSLVTELLSMEGRGEIDFREPASMAELYSLSATLSMQMGDRAKAFDLYNRAADVGHGPSALAMFRFLMPPPPGHKPDEYTGVVEPDLKLAETYYRQAERAGYNSTTHQFNQQEVK